MTIFKKKRRKKRERRRQNAKNQSDNDNVRLCEEREEGEMDGSGDEMRYESCEKERKCSI